MSDFTHDLKLISIDISRLKYVSVHSWMLVSSSWHASCCCVGTLSQTGVWGRGPFSSNGVHLFVLLRLSAHGGRSPGAYYANTR
ncbi:hypothetical protein, partial [Pseudovibrio sp. POLY-S9]|uniref:hypothetical protein n=1 Tax=Pseudovibrio sp. POLY-S9 TaxID=1576596 RepID=UPI001AD933F9